MKPSNQYQNQRNLNRKKRHVKINNTKIKISANNPFFKKKRTHNYRTRSISSAKSSVSSISSLNIRRDPSTNSVHNPSTSNTSNRSLPAFRFGQNNIATVPKQRARAISLPSLNNSSMTSVKPATTTPPCAIPTPNETINNLHMDLQKNIGKDDGSWEKTLFANPHYNDYKNAVDNEFIFDLDAEDDDYDYNYKNNNNNGNYMANSEEDYNYIFQDATNNNNLSHISDNDPDPVPVTESWKNIDTKTRLLSAGKSWGDIRKPSQEVDRITKAIHEVLNNPTKYGTGTTKQFWIFVHQLANTSRTIPAIKDRFKKICKEKGAYGHSVLSKFQREMDQAKSATVTTTTISRMTKYTLKMQKAKEQAEAKRRQKELAKDKRQQTLDNLVEIALIDMRNNQNNNNNNQNVMNIDGNDMSTDDVGDAVNSLIDGNKFKNTVNEIRDIVDDIRGSILARNQFTKEEYTLMIKATIDPKTAPIIVDEYNRITKKIDPKKSVQVFSKLLSFAKLLS